MFRLKIDDNKRYLSCGNMPFFWLGDTAWEMLHRGSREDMEKYLYIRKNQGFNIIQTIVLAEQDGLRTPNFYGRYPIKCIDGSYCDMVPDIDGEYSYWDHVDFFIDKAAELEMYVALLPTWGDKFNISFGKGPEVFDEENAEKYGLFIGDRYKNRDNIVWIMGGDRMLTSSRHFKVVEGMVRGIKKSGAKQIMSFHPSGKESSSTPFPDSDWLDFHMNQTGHHEYNYPNYEAIIRDRNLAQIKPVLDGEPRYEDHPVNFNPENGYFTDFDVRQAAYWSVFSGGLGITYGHHSVWNMIEEPSDYFIMTWKKALKRPGAEQMKYLKNLMLEANMCMEPSQNILKENYKGANYQATISNEHLIYVYTPCGLKISIDKSVKIDKSFFFNPRNGEKSICKGIEYNDKTEFIPPCAGRGEDMVLIIEKIK
jgi:hypothetical protein